jgi:hypothetical protein
MVQAADSFRGNEFPACSREEIEGELRRRNSLAVGHCLDSYR